MLQTLNLIRMKGRWRLVHLLNPAIARLVSMAYEPSMTLADRSSSGVHGVAITAVCSFKNCLIGMH